MKALQQLIMVFLAHLLLLSNVGFAATVIPNVIVIAADDMGFNDFGYQNGGQTSPTRNIDKYARYSTRLNNYYVSTNGHSSRVALQTGEHPASFGAQFNMQDDATVRYGLDPNVKILPQYLKELGFKTHAVGQWDLGFYSQNYLPTERGYDTFYGTFLSYGDYLTHEATDKKGHSGYDFHKNLNVNTADANAFKTELYAAEAVRLIKDHDRSKPFHLYVAFQAAQIHDMDTVCRGGYIPDIYYNNIQGVQDEQRRCYLALVSALDEAFGNIMKALEEYMMLIDSTVIFTTTSGGAVAGEHVNFASNAPFRGAKNTVWEGGIRGVGFIYNSLVIDVNGKDSNCLIHISDWLPTILHAYGMVKEYSNPSTLVPSHLYGEDQYNCLFNSGPHARDKIVHFAYINSAAIIFGDYKFIVDEDSRISGMDEWYGSSQSPKVSCQQSMETVCRPSVEPCLFNIKIDPCEKHNIAAEKPGLVHRARSIFREFNKTVNYNGKEAPDRRGDPANFEFVWQPWVEVSAALQLQAFPVILLITMTVILTL